MDHPAHFCPRCGASLQRSGSRFLVITAAVVLVVVFGLGQLLQLWLYVLTGNPPPPTMPYLLPALVSALLWPWLFSALGGLRMRLRVN